MDGHATVFEIRKSVSFFFRMIGKTGSEVLQSSAKDNGQNIFFFVQIFLSQHPHLHFNVSVGSPAKTQTFFMDYLFFVQAKESNCNYRCKQIKQALKVQSSNGEILMFCFILAPWGIQSMTTAKKTTLEKADFQPGWSELSWSGRTQPVLA